jgi:hypothetical protein
VNSGLLHTSHQKGLGAGERGKQANQMAKGKWQISNGLSICLLPFEF